MPKKIFTAVGVLVGVVAIGLLIGWLATKGSSTQVQIPPRVPEANTSSSSATQATLVSPPPTPSPAPISNTTITTPPTNIPIVTPAPQTHAIANTNAWEDKLEEVLASEMDDTNKVKQLFAMFPDLPADGQEEIALHLSNLVEDETYGPLGDLLKNAKLPEDVLDVLMADLLNRPNAAKLPLFLEIAFNPEHPKASEAKDLLELYLDEDYGTDQPKWLEKMREWLKENPD